MKRSSGVLMHLSSLPSDYGIGTLGRSAFDFVDFLAKSKMKLWQMLPVCPIDKYGSPYQSYSTFAGNFLFIDLEELIQKGLLVKADLDELDWGNDASKLNFDLVVKGKIAVLKKAFHKWLECNQDSKLWEFAKENNWVLNYAVFMVLLQKFKGECWWNWPREFKYRDRASMEQFQDEFSNEILFIIFEQFIFFEQWFKLKNYANEHGVSLVGDLAFYVAGNSADVWADPKNFCLDENLKAKKVAGCPPDAFAVDGQLWGNPVYDWSHMAENGYSWWIKRLKSCCDMFDIVRIDHFRGFESFYAIDASHTTAREGNWVKGPGIDFFNAVEKKLGKLNLIAEDLGFLTSETRELLKKTGFPGMKILQFAFDPREKSNFLPHTYEANSVCYTGTHDNNTVVGWFKEIDEEFRVYCKEYLNFVNDEEVHWVLIRTVMASVCNLAIIPVQDFLGLDESCRMNIPGTWNDNWSWRLTNNQFAKLLNLASKISKLVNLYCR